MIKYGSNGCMFKDKKENAMEVGKHREMNKFVKSIEVSHFYFSAQTKTKVNKSSDKRWV